MQFLVPFVMARNVLDWAPSLNQAISSRMLMLAPELGQFDVSWRICVQIDLLIEPPGGSCRTLFP